MGQALKEQEDIHTIAMIGVWLEGKCEAQAQKIKQLEEQVEKPKATEETEDTEEINYPDIDYKHLFKCGAFNATRGAMDEEYKECWKALSSGQIKTYKEWIDQEL